MGEPGWRWRATPFVHGWVHLSLVYSRWRSASLWLRNRPPAALAGPHRFVRRRDGLVVELGSDPQLYLWDVFDGVFRDLGESGTPEEIEAEVVSRTGAYWAEREVEWEADRAFGAIMTLVERALAVRAEELAQEPGWSNVAFGVKETAWRESDDPDAVSARGLFGSVEAELAVVGAVEWLIDLVPDGPRWFVQRLLYLERDAATDDGAIEAPEIRCKDSGELAAKLPRLLAELLELRPPGL